MRLGRLATIAAAPFLLVSCLLTPGQFTSTLDIKRDRSFTFTYVGEAIVADTDALSPDRTCDAQGEAACDPAALAAEKGEKAARQEAKLKEIAAALSKEEGYRSAQYLGNRKYRVDYEVSGRLDRNFIYPFNSDAAAIFPWIVVELRKDGTARVKAPGFGDENENALPGPIPLDRPLGERQGTFTLTTDAEIVMQNEESGVVSEAGGKRITWQVTPGRASPPTAVLRF